MLHVRVITPRELASTVLDYLRGSESVTNVIHLPGSAQKPPGDLILCDVAREDCSVITGGLTKFGLKDVGAVAVESIEVMLSDAAQDAEDHAAGAASDAVVWEQVSAQTSESAELSASFLAFMVLATLLAAVGILTDSVILVIGAMVVGPEFGPLAAMCVAITERRMSLAKRSALALLAGFPAGIFAAFVLTATLRGFDVIPGALSAHARAQTLFISHPDLFSPIVAGLAGVAGMLSLTTAKSGALIGVLISVTTIPAAANIGVAAAYGDTTELGGATQQLAINLGMLLLSSVGTLLVQRLAFRRRLRAARLRA
ncbi:MAG TPA: DUF389 domain-containing protein [Polyangiaceae bacterium]